MNDVSDAVGFQVTASRLSTIHHCPPCRSRSLATTRWSGWWSGTWLWRCYCSPSSSLCFSSAPTTVARDSASQTGIQLKHTVKLNVHGTRAAGYKVCRPHDLEYWLVDLLMACGTS